MHPVHLILLAFVLVATACPPNDNNDFGNAAAAANIDTSGTPETFQDGEGGDSDCGGPGPFAPPEDLDPAADITDVTVSQTTDSLTVEITYNGDAQTLAPNGGVGYGLVATAVDGTLIDVIQREDGWKVVDGVAKVSGEWVSSNVLRLTLTDLPAPVSRVNATTFGSNADYEYWCDRAEISLSTS